MFSLAVECSKCGKRFPCDKILTVCTKCGGSLLFRYDLAKVSEKVTRDVLKKRQDTFWKFLELLPLSSPESIVSLGEPYTPLFRLSNGSKMDSENVYVKDDGRLPTGTFKARGMAVAVSKLKELGVKRVAIPSAGNAAAALATYGAKAGMEVFAFLPKDVPESILKECVYSGAKVYLVNGLISDAGNAAKKLGQRYGYLDISTNKQPYRFEGYKVIAFEIAEQFHWEPPDTILCPTGGGEGTIGLWKGFEELRKLGWIRKIPRLIIVQSSGCAPLVAAYKENETEVREAWENAETIAAGLRVPYPFASYLTLRSVRETKGTAVEVDDEEILSSMKDLFKMGIHACPEAASTFAALKKLENEGTTGKDEKTLLYLTGNVMKYLDVLEIERDKIPLLDIEDF